MDEPHLADDLERALDREAPRRGDVPRELLARPTVGRLLALAAQDWAVLALAWVGMALSPVWTYPLFAVVAASRLHAFGVLLHDAAHMPLRGKSPAVRLLELLCGYPIATTLNAMRYHHLRHHRDNGMPSDPYFKAGVDTNPALYALNVARGLLLVPFWTVRPWFGLLALALPGLRQTYARVFLQDRSGRDVGGTREVADCARAEAGQAAFQLVLLAIALRWPAPFALGYLVPATIAGVLAAWRVLLEHRYVRVDDRKVSTIFATTWDHHLHPAVRWLFAPRNIGYHVVHHVHPFVGLEHLPALRDWYRTNHPDYPAPR